MSVPETLAASTWPNELAAARAGDAEALGRLLISTWPLLVRTANLNMIGELRSKKGASDIAQETVCEALKCFQTFQGSTSSEFQSWLRCMLKNNVRDTWRYFAVAQKRQLTKEILLSSDKIHCLDVRRSGDPAEKAENDEQHALLAAAMKQLPNEYFQILKLRHWEKASFEHISRVMSLPASSVRLMWNRALSELTRYINNQNATSH